MPIYLVLLPLLLEKSKDAGQRRLKPAALAPLIVRVICKFWSVEVEGFFA